MGKVKIIEPTKAASAFKEQHVGREKIRVAAYARVSTDHNDQETSFEAQQTHFKTLIEANPGWELVDIYADEESGTRAEKRENFMRMIADCENGKIQLVLTKSISRFARNTLDALNYIRKLKALKIPIIFTKESINTMDSHGEVLITILASIAQQESASISQNVQIGVRYHYQEGKVCSGVHQLLGYRRNDAGGLDLVPEEAWIVRRIFREYLDGYTLKHIVDRLNEDGVDGTKVTPSGLVVPRKWSYEGLDYLIRNEKYSGDLLLQKFYTVDYLTRTRARNEGQVPQYLAENNHAPIVPKSVFLQVQAEIERRRKAPINYNHHYPLSGRVICGDCGTHYRRVHDKRYGTVNWRCDTRVRGKKYSGIICHNKTVDEDELKAAVVQAFLALPVKEAELIRLDERLKWAGIRKADEMMEDLRRRMEQGEELEEEYAEVNAQRAVYVEKEMCIRNLLQRIRAVSGRDDEERDGPEHGACRDEEEFFTITRAPAPLKGYSGEDVIRHVEQIVVEPEKFTIRFKAGVAVEVQRG